VSCDHVEGVDGAGAVPEAVEYSLFHQLLHRILRHCTVEAEPDGKSDLIGGRAVGLDVGKDQSTGDR